MTNLRLLYELAASIFLLTIGNIYAQDLPKDSVAMAFDLDEFVVCGSPLVKEVTPVQKLSGEQLKNLSAFSVADSIRYFSGIQLKNYGRIVGLKTVNVRSMWTHHVGVFYDSIQLGNAQNGQIDPGKFSLENIEEVSLYNGQKSNIFQYGKDFGSSVTVYLHSRTPRFNEGKNYNLRATVKGGSFDLVNPSLLYEYKINNNLSASINGEYINSSGKYKYRYKRVFPNTNEVMYDTIAVRLNGDIYSTRLPQVIRIRISAESVPMNAKITSAQYVNNGAVETEHQVAAPSTKGDHGRILSFRRKLRAGHYNGCI